MVPRALWTQDWIWLTGSLWGSLIFGWAQLLRCGGAARAAQGRRERAAGGRRRRWQAAPWRSPPPRIAPPSPPCPRSMCLGRSPATGARFLPVPLFAAATTLLWAWFAAVFLLNRRARKHAATA